MKRLSNFLTQEHLGCMDETETEPSVWLWNVSVYPNIPSSLRLRLSSIHACGHCGQSPQLLFSDADMESRDCRRVWKVSWPLFGVSPFT